MIPNFRAYLIKHEKIVDVREINYNLLEIGWRDDDFHDTVSSFDDIKFIQPTGLLDKNGTEIFEGDILKVEYGDLLGETRETLKIAKNPFEYSMEEAKFLDFSYIVEIIGNKFEHPHLLGED
ncbi:YopX family protein [Mammaliicoccus sciuri]|uniref:YopX family protein n=1 Tax=Mammaliicoccus sciuri TaxID=1296 RepID=UPI003F5541DE